MKNLYHYCSNKTCFNILQSKSIWLCDIRKSNDFNELQIFYHDIFYYIWDIYKKNPFSFIYNGESDDSAIMKLLEESKSLWETKFLKGDISDLVMCFSEKNDMLSQWRGYADNGKGCCIGFSYDLLREYCSKLSGLLRLEKITYLSDKQIEETTRKYAEDILNELKTLRQWIVENMTHDDEDADTNGLLGYNFNGMLENVFIDSLKYKSRSFKEEKEWRLFLSNPAYKEPKWVLGHNHIYPGPNGFTETINYLKNKYKF